MAGEPTHIELGAPDAKRARAFFGTLFAWTVESFGDGDQAAIATPTIRGGLHDGVTTSTLTTYFRVDDIDQAVGKVRALGGQAEEPSPDEPGFGRFSTGTDARASRSACTNHQATERSVRTQLRFSFQPGSATSAKTFGERGVKTSRKPRRQAVRRNSLLQPRPYRVLQSNPRVSGGATPSATLTLPMLPVARARDG